MVYGIWGRPKERETRRLDEKAFRRKDLAAWDTKWHALSAPARLAFLDEVKGPVKTAYASARKQPSVPTDKFAPNVLKELADAGFVEVRAAKPKAPPDRVFAAEELVDFVPRMRVLRRFHLLNAKQPSEFPKYVDYVFYGAELTGTIHGILGQAGIQDYLRVDEALPRYVISHRWPAWVARSLKDPLADRLLEVVREAGGPIPLVDLLGRIDDEPGKVRSAYDKLVSHLALVEDLDPKTWEIKAGLLPDVREAEAIASRPRQRPPLRVSETLRDFGPAGSLLVDDLRSFLLEVASEPPRLRQDKALFQKEIERFLDALVPAPGWLAEVIRRSDEGRVHHAHGWARILKLVKETADGKLIRVRLAPRGSQWLADRLEDQYGSIYDVLRAPVSREETYAPENRFFYPGLDIFSNYGPGDSRFLGANVTVMKGGKKKNLPYLWDVKPADHQALRDAIYQVFAQLPVGVFHRWESVVDHAVFEDKNPLLLGLGQDQVSVYWDSHLVPPLEERREEAGRLALDTLLRSRLIPLGCVRAAIDEEGKLCVARGPWLDVYFGRAHVAAEVDGASTGGSKVVVQPDFSVVVIGLNPAPVAELAPFSERTTKGGSQGAMVLKLTRESVVKAVAHGMKPAEIVARLKRHASNEVPANVLREVEEWCAWVRQVTPSTLTVLRCPDRDTADRVLGALKRQAERVNDTMIALDAKKLTTVERNKLRDHGIIVQGEADAEVVRPKVKKKKRYRYY